MDSFRAARFLRRAETPRYPVGIKARQMTPLPIRDLKSLPSDSVFLLQFRGYVKLKPRGNWHRVIADNLRPRGTPTPAQSSDTDGEKQEAQRTKYFSDQLFTAGSPLFSSSFPCEATQSPIGFVRWRKTKLCNYLSIAGLVLRSLISGRTPLNYDGLVMRSSARNVYEQELKERATGQVDSFYARFLLLLERAHRDGRGC